MADKPQVSLPNALPRPAGELDALAHVWRVRGGWQLLTEINNNYIGLFYIGTAILFLVLGGILALIMRLQLAVPHAGLVDAATYNQFFTTHGTVMMFLFAVPAVEAMAVYLLPGMLAARDLPFPRLSAYAYWAYAIGGLIFFASLFFGRAPDGGWFMYPPLTSFEFSPTVNADFWLLGIGFIEISAIAGAIELIVGVLRTRAPGMTLGRMPIYAWAMLVVGVMIVFAFPPVIVATALLELERAFHWPFFVADKGGDPLLWQHLFWLFGHPDVYIIFLPAAGMISMILPAMVGQPLVGYRWVVLAMVATGFLSFLLWVHHMFATGIPQISVSFFAAASMAVSIPTGIQIFAWIATLWSGRARLHVPMLFVLGFFFIFVLGGLTGVMVAVVPFNWQVHDSYFVVAHFHYVLIGGMIFPLFGAFYYWAPIVSGTMLSERLGRWVFGLMFVGFNVTFFPMHISGLLGMPRRIYTYAEGLGWEWLNLTSTVGAIILAMGIGLFLIQIALQLRIADRVRVDPWGAGTLEWLPLDNYAVRSIPRVPSRYPLQDRPELADEVERGEHYLPGTATGRRETIVTSMGEAEPQYLMLMPEPSWHHFIAAAATAALFFLLTIKLVLPALACGLIVIAAIIAWLWQLDAGPTHPPIAIGGNIRLPVYATGPTSVSWGAMVVLIAVSGASYVSLAFSYVYTWTISSGPWPPMTLADEGWLWPLAIVSLYAASSAVVWWGGRRLASCNEGADATVSLALVGAVVLAAGATIAAVQDQWRLGIRPDESAYGALVYTFWAAVSLHVVTITMMALFTVARALARRLNAAWRVSYDNTALLWHYTTAVGVVTTVIVYGFPSVVDGP